jgi:2-succinyl-6-hydroxy-2,4-cyclohexadiene-1-carboxylate synthase
VARVVLVPGFTQTAAAWSAVATLLRAAGHDVVALDVPGGLDFPTTATAIGAKGGPGTYVGYSMGGRLTLRLALDHPELVERLGLVSASPGIADAAERDERRAADEVLARDIECRGVEPFLRDWLAQLAASLRNLGTGTQEPLWHRLDELRMPVALVTGRADSKFASINDAMQAACTSVTSLARVHIDGGHALPLEQPAALADALVDWLAR